VTSSNALLTVTLPAPLQFEMISLLPDSRVRLELTGQPGVYTLESSITLTNWNSVTNLTNISGAFEFIDEAATNHACRFYRARPVP